MQQIQPSVREGDHVSIPKGTEFHQRPKGQYSCYPDKHTKGNTTRDAVVKVAEVQPIYHDSEFIMEDHEVYRSVNNGPGQKVTEQRRARKIIGYFVLWSDGKYTPETNVTKADAPVRKAPDPEKAAQPKAPTLRMRMVPKTQWKLIGDVPRYRVKKVPTVHERGHTYDERVLDHFDNLPAGTVIKITGKSHTGFPGMYWSASEGVWFPVEVVSAGALNGLEMWLQLSDLKDKIEQDGEAEVIPLFYIWDRAEKKYYSGYDYDYQKSGNMDITYTDKLSKAKSFKMLNLVRTHALIQTGYYDDLPEAWGSVPDWMQGRKVFDVPDTWEIVKIDKLTKKEIERIELIDTFKRTWKLRALTVKFGSAVRAVYSALEKKGELEKFSAMLSFSTGKDAHGYYNDDDIPVAEKDAIKELLKQFDKGDIKIHKSSTGFAVGAKDATTAMMVKLAYSGDLECALIDFTTMDEVVANGT